MTLRVVEGDAEAEDRGDRPRNEVAMIAALVVSLGALAMMLSW